MLLVREADFRPDVAARRHPDARQHAYGERRIIDILGGTVEGPKLNGKVLRRGADWQIVRADGVVHLQARYTIETNTGGLILVNAEGYRHGPPDVMAALARDETVDPARYYFRTASAVRDLGPGFILAQPYPGDRPWRLANKQVRIEVFEVL